jgi:FkbM family methyltransferase
MNVSSTINKILRKIGFEFRRYFNDQILINKIEYDQLIKSNWDWEFIKMIHHSELVESLNFLNKSKSQLSQDLFVLNELSFKSNGFFVEFGATNGLTLSNTYTLEKFYGWNGILAEPALCWQKELKINRDCFIENKCVWSVSHAKLNFNETMDPELSTINNFSNSDLHSISRKKSQTYEVETISLIDMLDKYNAPTHIDYLSIDTEGSELQILSTFDFDKYSFGVITVEHNYTSDREKIYELLTSKNYKRVHSNISKFDDWYVNSLISGKNL